MSSGWKTALWVLIVIVMVPLTCCGSGYLFLYFKAPVRWEYETKFVTPERTDIEFSFRLRGSNDYSMHETGPRHLIFHAFQDYETTNATLRVLEVKVHGSESGDVAALAGVQFPYVMDFEKRSEESMRWGSSFDHHASLVSEDFDIEPSSQEVITVTIQVEIVKPDEQSQRVYLEAVFEPNRIHHPIGYFLPSR